MNHDYLERIDAVRAYIEANYNQKINLETLASISNFSKYHFTRIFTSMMGVTPIAYLNQKRLEKSINYLKETNQSILDIAHQCGFDSISTFNALFKKHYHLTPSELRKAKIDDRNFPEQLRNFHEELSSYPCYNHEKGNLLRRIWTMNVSVVHLPDYEVAYVRHVGSYLETYHAWNALGKWASENGLYPPEHIYIGISLDDPHFVDEFACRYDACVTLPQDFNKETHPEMSYQSLSGGQYALYHFYDTIDKLAITYQSLFGHWLPNSEFDADDKPCLEFCMNNPATDPEGKAKVDLYIPIKTRK